VVASFRSKGLHEIYSTGITRRIGAEYIRKCVRILQALETATQPEDMNIAGYRFHAFAREPTQVVRPRERQLPDHVRLVGRERDRSGFRGLPLIRQEMNHRNALPPIHPGEIIREDVLPATGLSVAAAAKALGVSRQMLHGILAGRKPLSAVMCLKVSRLFGSTPEFWMRLQAEYDLKMAARDKRIMQRVSRIVPVRLPEEVRA
jgi:antitoxin HigA-1